MCTFATQTLICLPPLACHMCQKCCEPSLVPRPTHPSPYSPYIQHGNECRIDQVLARDPTHSSNSLIPRLPHSCTLRNQASEGQVGRAWYLSTYDLTFDVMHRRGTIERWLQYLQDVLILFLSSMSVNCNCNCNCTSIFIVLNTHNHWLCVFVFMA